MSLVGFFVVLFLVSIYPTVSFSQDLAGVSFSLSKEERHYVKTKFIAKMKDNNHYHMCGNGYFIGFEAVDETKSENQHSYLKFNPISKGFNKIDFYLYSKNDGKEYKFNNGNYECLSVKVHNANIILLIDNSTPLSWIIISDKAYALPGYVNVINNRDFIIYCTTKDCFEKVSEINRNHNINIITRALKKDIIDVSNFFGDKVIIYTIDALAEEISGKVSYCSEANDINMDFNYKILFNMCSVIAQRHYRNYVSYYEGGRYYFFPFNQGRGFVYYYECMNLNSCVTGIFPDDYYLKNQNYFFEGGTISSYGGYTTQYSDGFGPDYIFCVSRNDKNDTRKCISRVPPKENIVNTEDRKAMENEIYDDTGEYLGLFYAEGKYYFYITDSISDGGASYVEEIIDPLQ